MQRTLHGTILASVIAIAAGALLSGVSAQPRPPRPSYEIWITNQATDSVLVYDSRTLRKIAEIPVDDDGLHATSKPHTLSFSPDGRYAYVANVGAKQDTNNVTIIHATGRRIVTNLPAGPGTHMVLPSPSGREAFAANAGGNTVTEIVHDTVSGQFTTGRTFAIKGIGRAKSHPTCLAPSGDATRLYVTNAGDPKGDPSKSGFLAVLSTASGKEQSRVLNLGNEVCGFARTKDGGNLFLTIGGTVNQFAILDAKTDKIIKQESTGGNDPHGIGLLPGGHQVWIINRGSSNVTVLSTTTGAHFRTFFNIGDKPDLLDFSPEGENAIITLRGDPATPLAGGPGKEPGFVILDTETGKVVSKVPIEGDPHGIAVRPRNP
jgi:DNA-binding beta-propeller fold protein YncE